MHIMHRQQQQHGRRGRVELLSIEVNQKLEQKLYIHYWWMGAVLGPRVSNTIEMASELRFEFEVIMHAIAVHFSLMLK